MSEHKTHNIMNKLTTTLAVAFLLIIAAACQPGPKPIVYGEEACEYCRMSIVDKRYAAQLVSETGKTYSFDAIECMINYKGENQDHDWHMELVTDYTSPGELVPAEDAMLLRSENLPSPMGMYLTAVPSRKEAEVLQAKHMGTIYTYREVVESMDSLPAL